MVSVSRRIVGHNAQHVFPGSLNVAVVVACAPKAGAKVPSPALFSSDFGIYSTSGISGGVFGGCTGGSRGRTCPTNYDARMHHMKNATVRDLRYRFREVEDLLREGEEIEITKRKRVIARLVPLKPATPSLRPDFLARLKKIYRNKPQRVSGAELISRERARY